MGSSKNGTSVWTKINAYLNTFNQMLIFAITIYITFMCWYIGPTARSWHIWLCTIGYQFLMAESILAFSSTNSCTAVHSRRTNNHLHWIMQLIGAFLSMAGFAIEYLDRSRHFGSMHSILGMISLAFLMLSMLNGLSALWATELKSYIKPVYSKFAHNFCGIFTFVVGMVSLIYSYDTGRIIRASTPEIRVALQITTGITMVLSVYMACSSLYGQLKDIVGNRVRLPSISGIFNSV